MREILGRRRKLRSRRTRGSAPAACPDLTHPTDQPDLTGVAVAAVHRHWPVVPGVRPDPASPTGCGCPDPECALPGDHPADPGLLAATTDERMVRWWWGERPAAPVLLATGRGASAVSLPAVAAARALAALDRAGVATGPVLATRDRWALLVAPYSLPRLGELLYAKDHVPGSLRFHGEGGYLLLPPSAKDAGRVRWERPPAEAPGGPALPEIGAVLDALVDTLNETGVNATDL
ncbi:bifunctional DNA primase/polymerase [Streptomyces albidoflavus]|uniref:bifunctional DNA primase/polymerase n=1 Tax=Streptomyces albidoflavus TaxID=1886 RepID=UPI00344D0FFE